MYEFVLSGATFGVENVHFVMNEIVARVGELRSSHWNLHEVQSLFANGEKITGGTTTKKTRNPVEMTRP